MHPGWSICIMLAYIILGIGFNNTLKNTKRGGFPPVIMIWPLFLVILAFVGPEFLTED